MTVLDNLATFTDPRAVVDATGRHPLEPERPTRRHAVPWTADRVLADARAVLGCPRAAGRRGAHIDDPLRRLFPASLTLAQVWAAAGVVDVLEGRYRR